MKPERRYRHSQAHLLHVAAATHPSRFKLTRVEFNSDLWTFCSCSRSHRGLGSLRVHHGTVGLRSFAAGGETSRNTPSQSSASLRCWMRHKIKPLYFCYKLPQHPAPPPRLPPSHLPMALLLIPLPSLPIQFHAAVRDNSDIISHLHKFECSRVIPCDGRNSHAAAANGQERESAEPQPTHWECNISRVRLG